MPKKGQKGKVTNRKGQVEKEPLDIEEELFTLINYVAQFRKGDEGTFALQTILILVKTGMHISCLCNPKKYKLRASKTHVIWKRTKKKGKAGETRVRISIEIKSFVHAYINDDVWKRPKYRQFYNDMLKDIGVAVGFPHLSPMTLRHTAGVWLYSISKDIQLVMQVLNCSEKTARRYAKYAPKGVDDILEDARW